MDFLRSATLGPKVDLFGRSLQIPPQPLAESPADDGKREFGADEKTMRREFFNCDNTMTNRLRVSCSSLGSNRATREMRQLSAVLLALIFAAVSPHVLRAQEAVSTTGSSGATSSTSAPSSAT